MLVMDRKRVGVVGVGAIGGIVVRGLVADGWPTDVYDIDGAAIERAVAEGAHAVTSLAELAERCSIIAICLVTGEQVHEVVRTMVDSAPSAAPTFVVHSTIGIDAVTSLSAVAQGAVVIDAPVSSNRTDDLRPLFCFVGALDERVPVDVTAMLKSYCRGFEVMGDVGAGHLVKVVNNLISLLTLSAVGEALNLCAARDVDPLAVSRVALSGSANSWVLANWSELAPRISFVRKDLNVALEAGRAAGLDMPLTVAALDASEFLFGDGSVLVRRGAAPS